MSYGNITLTVRCKIQLVEIILITEAPVVETTEAVASVASNQGFRAQRFYLHFCQNCHNFFKLAALKIHSWKEL